MKTFFTHFSTLLRVRVKLLLGATTLLALFIGGIVLASNKFVIQFTLWEETPKQLGVVAGAIISVTPSPARTDTPTLSPRLTTRTTQTAAFPTHTPTATSPTPTRPETRSDPSPTHRTSSPTSAPTQETHPTPDVTLTPSPTPEQLTASLGVERWTAGGLHFVKGSVAANKPLASCSYTVGNSPSTGHGAISDTVCTAQGASTGDDPTLSITVISQDDQSQTVTSP